MLENGFYLKKKTHNECDEVRIVCSSVMNCTGLLIWSAYWNSPFLVAIIGAITKPNSKFLIIIFDLLPLITIKKCCNLCFCFCYLFMDNKNVCHKREHEKRTLYHFSSTKLGYRRRLCDWNEAPLSLRSCKRYENERSLKKLSRIWYFRWIIN